MVILHAAGIVTANGGVQVGTAASIYTNGNIAAAGIVTANGGLAVGAAITLAVNGNAAFTLVLLLLVVILRLLVILKFLRT